MSLESLKYDSLETVADGKNAPNAAASPNGNSGFDNPLATGIEQSFSNAVANEFQSRRMANHRYSLRAFANHLGVDHSLLSKVLRGKARMGIPLMLEIGGLLKFKEEWFVKLSEILESSQTELDFKKQISALKLRQRKVRNHSTIESDKSDFISNWYDSVILEMTTLANWNPDPKWISIRLGGVVSPKQCQDSIQRLERLNLIAVENAGAIVRANRETLMVATDVPRERIRHFHREILARATSSVDHLELADRLLMACTVPLKTEDVPRVQEVIREAIRKITSLAVQEGADEVFQISNQMVRVTFDQTKPHLSASAGSESSHSAIPGAKTDANPDALSKSESDGAAGGEMLMISNPETYSSKENK